VKLDVDPSRRADLEAVKGLTLGILLLEELELESDGSAAWRDPSGRSGVGVAMVSWRCAGGREVK